VGSEAETTKASELNRASTSENGKWHQDLWVIWMITLIDSVSC